MPMWGTQSLRLFRHELRRGELTIICFAIILAVATVFSLTNFSEHIKSAIISESNSFIASDRILQSSRPVDQAWLQQAQQANLDKAELLLFSSMVFAKEEMLLASVKAATIEYPLRGELLVTDLASGETKSQKAPNIGTVWVERSLLNKLNVQLGESIELGVANFTVAGVIEKEPDASFSVFTQGPRVIMNMADVEQTQIVQPGSRITYRYLFAGDKQDIESYETWIKPLIQDNQRFYDIKSRQSPLARALERSEKFLSLAGMLGILLAAVAISVASNRYKQRHQPMVAVFKSMGASKNYIAKLYLLHWTCLSVFSITVGLLVGYVLHIVAMNFISDYLPNSAMYDGMYPLIVAISTGVLCAGAFAITPMRALIATSALAVVRGFDDVMGGNPWLRQLPSFLAVFALLLLFSKDITLTFILIGSSVVVVGVLMVLGYSLIRLGRGVGSGAGKSLHLAIANLQRRAKQNNVQLISFTIAIMLLLIMLVVRNDLLDDWQAQLPENAPNQFLVNVNKQQAPKVEAFLQANGMKTTELYPIVRGRLTAINEDKVGKQVSKEEEDKSDQGRRGIGRELNLTWHDKLPTENIVVEGKWFEPSDLTPQVSIEEKLADRLDIKLGDELTFQIGSEVITLPVTSLREVNWQSMQPNFYMIFSKGVLSDFPATYITAMYVPMLNKPQMQQFLAQYPTISVIDVDAMINQLRTIITQVSLAIEFILALVVLAGSLVLIAQVQASMEERERELAILRTLGAKGSLLRNATLLEFVVLGGISGFLASVIMEVAVYFVQTELFKMTVSWHFEYWLLGMAAGGAFVGLVGFLSCRRLLNLTSVTLIRRTL